MGTAKLLLRFLLEPVLISRELSISKHTLQVLESREILMTLPLNGWLDWEEQIIVEGVGLVLAATVAVGAMVTTIGGIAPQPFLSLLDDLLVFYGVGLVGF